MSAALKYSDIVKQFDGQSDFSEWVRKLELVALLQKVKDLQSFMPLFLSGGAFAVYESLDSDVKADYSKLKQSLMEAFSTHPLLAYEQFITRKLVPGESVDVYVADLRRTGNRVDSQLSDEWIKCALVYGLPEAVRQQLKAACSVEKLPLTKLIERVRALVSTFEWDVGTEALSRSSRRLDMMRKDSIEPKQCFVCKKEDHLARACPEKVVTCFVCNEKGHISRSCPKIVKNT